MALARRSFRLAEVQRQLVLLTVFRNRALTWHDADTREVRVSGSWRGPNSAPAKSHFCRHRDAFVAEIGDKLPGNPVFGAVDRGKQLVKVGIVDDRRAFRAGADPGDLVRAASHKEDVEVMVWQTILDDPGSI